MKKSFLGKVMCALLMAVPFMASAVEYGGVLTNNSQIKTNQSGQFKLDQQDEISLWLKTPLVKNSSTDSYFAAQGTYSFEYNFDKAAAIQYVDLDLFKFVYRKLFDGAEINLSAGRFFTYDLSGIIYSQKADGLDVEFKNDFMEADVYAAYTGLLNAQADTMLDGNMGKLSGKDSRLYDLASKNIVTIAYVKFPSLFLQQTVAVQGMGTFGFDSTAYTRLYATVNVSGPAAPVVYYNLCSTMGFTKYGSDAFEAANLTSASVTVFPPVFNSSVSLNAVYASGNQGKLKAFRSVTSNTFSEALDEPEYSGMAKLGLSATAKPVLPVLVSASCDVIFNAAAGNSGDKIEYKGIQFSVGTDWQIVSDFMIGASYTQYSDKSNSNIDKKQIAVKASLKF